MQASPACVFDSSVPAKGTFGCPFFGTAAGGFVRELTCSVAPGLGLRSPHSGAMGFVPDRRPSPTARRHRPAQNHQQRSFLGRLAWVVLTCSVAPGLGLRSPHSGAMDPC